MAVARYSIIVPQNLAAIGVEFTNKELTITRGCLLSASKDVNREAAVLAVGTQNQILAVDANGDLAWIDQGVGHTQGTDTGTTGTTFDIDSDGMTNGVRLKSATGALSLRNLADDANADLTVKNLTISGDLTVSGTTTTINATTLTVDDKNIELGSVTTPTDITADGGGITLKGDTDKTIIWDNTNDNWTSNQDFNLPNGKVYKINNVALSYSDVGAAPALVSAPATKTSTGTAGKFAFDSTYGYYCYATNQWAQFPIAINW